MIVMLDINDKRRFCFSLFKKDRIITHTASQDDISVMNIKYTRYHKAINMKKIEALCSGSTDTLLCHEGIIPDKARLMRFCDNTLSIKLMENFIFSILSEFDPDNLRICVCDPSAQFYELTEKLFSYSRSITVATEMQHFYSCRADEIAASFGGQLTMADNASMLPACDILIHPGIVTSALPEHKFVFTAYPPMTKTANNVIYKYLISVPESYRKIIPENADINYFLCALYSICGKTELGLITPEKCLSVSGALSKNYIVNKLSESSQ